MKILRALVVTLGLVFSASQPKVLAQPSDAGEQRYFKLVRQAVAEFEAAHWEEAGALFQQAHDLAPSARTFRGLGLASFEQRRYVDAIGQLDAALADQRKPLTESQRTEVRAVIDRAKQFIATYDLDLQPSYAEVVVDGRRVSIDARTLVLDAGPHTITIRTSGYPERVENIRAVPGTRETLSISLVQVVNPSPDTATAPTTALAPEASAASEVAPKDLRPSPKSRGVHRPWTWTLGGVGLASVVAGIGLRAGMLHQQNELDACNASLAGDACQSVADRGSALQTASIATFSIGGVLLGSAAVAYFLEGRASKSEVQAAVLPGGLWLGYRQKL